MSADDVPSISLNEVGVDAISWRNHRLPTQPYLEHAAAAMTLPVARWGRSDSNEGFIVSFRFELKGFYNEDGRPAPRATSVELFEAAAVIRMIASFGDRPLTDDEIVDFVRSNAFLVATNELRHQITHLSTSAGWQAVIPDISASAPPGMEIIDSAAASEAELG